jgi:hypothetical protein
VLGRNPSRGSSSRLIPRTSLTWEDRMQRSRCVDDFPAIRARMEELQREREQAARKNAAGQDHGSAGSPDRWDGTSRRPIATEEQRRVFFQSRA